MGYFPFNLTTLQLPAPSANMTKAEYKDVYGIDLDKADIKAFTLVVFNNEKYAIDQIKEIEGGYEIYFNGRILSVTDVVQTSDEVYDVVNSKPIYFHPISSDIRQGGNVVGRFTCCILNNSPEPIENMSALIALVRSWGLNTALISVTGGFYTGTDDIILSVIRVTSSVAELYGYDVTTHAGSTGDATSNYSYTGWTDGVNKLN